MMQCQIKRIDTITLLPPLNCSEPFKMFYSGDVVTDDQGNSYGRVILSCAASDRFLILSPRDRAVLQAVEIPDIYKTDYNVDDVLIGPKHAVLSLFHFPGTNGVVLFYNITYDASGDIIILTKEETLGASSSIGLWRNNLVPYSYLYVSNTVPGNVIRYSWGSFEDEGQISITGATGISHRCI